MGRAERLDDRLVGLAGARVGSARRGDAVDEDVEAAEPLRDQVEHLVLGGVGERVGVDEREVGAELLGDRAVAMVRYQPAVAVRRPGAALEATPTPWTPWRASPASVVASP